jgi:signal transduction histidine kinase
MCAELGALATTLVSAETLDDLLLVAPPALARVLGGNLACRIDIFTATGTQPPRDDPEDRLCVPLVVDGVVIGAIILSDTAIEVGNDLRVNEQHARLAATMLAAAVASREQADAEHARLLKAAAELKFEVVAMLAHEMRTPLASIKGYTTALLLEDIVWDAGTRAEFLRTINEESDRLTHLIEEILETAAIDAGTLRIDVEPVLIQQIARSVVARLGMQSDRHRFALMFPSDFPIVEADAERIEQVLANLIDNALKYSPDGGLIVVRGERRPDEVLVSVVDQGIGIAPEHLNMLFERFFRASPTRRQHVVGAGLGLPISESIVRAHGGRIWAESAVGSGTTFSFTLPWPRPSVPMLEPGHD